MFEELAESVVGWELHFCQLSRAGEPFFVEQIAGPSVMISRARFPAAFYQQGGVTAGYRMVSLIMPGPGFWRWCGESVTAESLVVMPVGGDFESFSGEHFDAVHLAIPITLLRAVAESRFGEPLHNILPDERCFCPRGGTALMRLRELLLRYAPGAGASSYEPSPGLRRSVEREMAFLVLACLADNESRQPTMPAGRRWRALERALREINTSSAPPRSVAQLLTSTGVSRRTLEHAFRDGLGTSPANYIKASRLHRLNQALLHSDAGQRSVAELALREGFEHLGQLAADYRSLFGELPSATLKRQIN